MNVPMNAPAWSERPLATGRPKARSGMVGSGMFSRVDYLDFLDGDSGHAVVRSFGASHPEASLSQVISTGHEIGLEEDRFTTILIPLSGRIVCATASQDLSCRPGEALLLPTGRRRTVTRREGGAVFHAVVVNISGLPNPPNSARTVRAATVPDLAMACGILTSLCVGGGGPVPLAFASALQLLRDVLACDDAERDTARLPHRRGVSPALARAEEMLRERLSEDLSMIEVANAAGISLRQMQEMFRRKHGLSPHAFLTRLRLEQAHLALKSGTPPPTVTEAALAAGFSHLGRFPAIYRARFGTLPSQTRAALR